MKKVLLFIAAAALTLSSCVKEQFAGAEGNIETVSFGLALDNGVQTRADGDAPIADKLYYAVFDENDALIAEFKATSQNVTEYPASVDIRLTKGQTYTVAFWAQNSTTDAYTVSDDLKITVNYNKANNDVKRDAFFGKETFTVGESSNNHEVTLTRPFAQLNVGITDEDLEAAAKTGVVIANSAVKVSGVADSFDVFTGTATGSVDAVYTLGKVPTAALTVGTDVYNWLSMSYLLIDSKTTSTIELTFDPADQSKTDITIREGLSNIPLQRNWRTNIVGNLLTGNVHFEISLLEDFIEPGFNITDEDLNGVIPADEFYARLQEGGAVYVNEARESINFNDLEIAQETVVILNEKVDEIKLGGNKAVDTKAASTMPNITIVIPKDVEYPAFSFNGKTENYTIKGDLNTSKPLANKILTSGSVKNFTVENVKATGNAKVESSGTNITVKNCVATDLNGSFVYLSGTHGANILNNTIAFAASYDDPNDKYDNAICLYYCAGVYLIEGNVITKTSKHGIFSNGGSDMIDLTISNNTISGVYEDGIKTDRAAKVTVTGNVIDAADYGIRLDRVENKEAEYVITDNTISIDGFENDNKTATSAIRVRYRADEYPGGVTVDLTAKDNKVGTHGIPAGKYADFTSEGMTVTGDFEFPFSIADGVAFNNGIFGISNLAGLQWFADVVNGVKTHSVVFGGYGEGDIFTGQTVKLLADINLASVENWEPVGKDTKSFRGTFDGCNHTISNVTIDSERSHVGFFGYVTGSVKNLNLADVDIRGAGVVGAVAGACLCNTVQDCSVDGGSVTTTNKGEHAGGVVGLASTDGNPAATVTGCSVKNLTINGYNNLGGVVGAAVSANVNKNNVENVTIFANQLPESGVTESNVGEVVGWNLNNSTVTENTTSNVTLNILAVDENGTLSVGGGHRA